MAATSAGPHDWLTEFADREQRIKQQDETSLRERWHFGQRAAESGLTQRAVAEAAGCSRSEVGHRIQFAKEYPECEVGNALAVYGSWHAICRRGLGNRGKKNEEARPDANSFEAYLNHLYEEIGRAHEAEGRLGDVTADECDDAIEPIDALRAALTSLREAVAERRAALGRAAA